MIETQCFVPYAPTKLIVEPSKLQHLYAQTKTVMHDVIKLAMVYLPTKLVMQKKSGRSITWKCPRHGTGITEITIPNPPVYEVPSRPSTVGKSCSICKNPICTRYADLAHHCGNPTCDNVCHLAAECSGFVNTRRATRARIPSTQVWNCHLHSSSSSSAHPST